MCSAAGAASRRWKARVMRVSYYSPYDQEVHEDPYPVYAALREEAPAYRNDELGFWALSRHGDVTAAFRDHELFARGGPLEPQGSLPPAGGGRDAHRTACLVEMDPQRHAQLRTVISRSFTPRRAARLEPLITDLTHRYLEPALGHGSFDFIADLASPLPVDVVSGLIGVPGADRDDVRRLTLAMQDGEDVPGAPPGTSPAVPGAGHDLAQYYRDLLAERRQQPSGDLASALLEADMDGDRLSEDEVVAVLLAMVAGSRTTAMLLGNAWYWAWRNPGQRAAPLKDPDRVPDWIEETLRYDGSIQFVSRALTAGTRLHGELIPAGATVLLLAGSANRDPLAFPDPDRYDLDRDTAAMVGFGAGRHLCLGAPLAELTARIVLAGLVQRVRDYEIGTEGIRRVHSVNVRGFRRLPTTVSSRPGRPGW
jgi:cytochrome P450